MTALEHKGTTEVAAKEALPTTEPPGGGYGRQAPGRREVAETLIVLPR